jgi:hypothetical protein
MDFDNINRRIIKLWTEESKNNDQDSLSIVPQLLFNPHKINKKGTLLYVGINPSFSSTNFKWLAKKMGDIDRDIAVQLDNEKKVERFYSWADDKVDDDYYSLLKKIEYFFIENYPYFKKANIIAEKCGLNLQSIDVFLNRETSQNCLKKAIFKNQKDLILTDFAKKQLEIFFESIKVIKPKAILVGNALASDIIKKYKTDNIVFDEKIGTYFLKEKGFSAPIFFSGMLSGQRALDNHSIERLEWHIKNCLNIN